MFDRAVDEVEQSGASRDSFVESVVGIKKAMRELAFELKVDPYSDFTPLRDGLEDMARVMAAGDISVSAAVSAIPGGAGIAVSATSRASNLANPIRDKSSAEIAALVTAKLKIAGRGRIYDRKLRRERQLFARRPIRDRRSAGSAEGRQQRSVRAPRR